MIPSQTEVKYERIKKFFAAWWPLFEGPADFYLRRHQNPLNHWRKHHIEFQIRRPLEEGPPGCEEFPRSSIFDLGLRWNHITALNFLDFHIWILWRVNLSFLMSHVSCLRSCWTVYCPQKSNAIALNPLATQDLGWPQNHHENSSIFEPVSKATKAMKIGPEATQNHEKSSLESQEIQFLRKLICAILSMPNACFPIPDTQI